MPAVQGSQALTIGGVDLALTVKLDSVKNARGQALILVIKLFEPTPICLTRHAAGEHFCA